MPAETASLSAAIVTFTATYLLHSTLLLTAAWLGLRVFRVSSHLLTERVWKLAAVTGIVTAGLQCSLGLSGSVLNLVAGKDKSQPTEVATPKRPQRHDPGPTLAPAPARTDLKPEMVESVKPSARILPAPRPSGIVDVPSGAEPAVMEPERLSEPSPASLARGEETLVVEPDIDEPPTDKGASSPLTLIDVVANLALLAFLIGAVRLLWQRVSLHRRLVRYEPIGDGPASSELAALLSSASIRRHVRLLCSDAESAPVAFGVVRWTIVLPAGIEHKLDRGELRALLAHEVAHLVRGDAVWLGVGGLLCSCLAFQPLNLLARWNWRRAGEFLCDDWAAKHACGLALARCLTRVAQWRLDSRIATVTLAASGNRSQLSQRVERLVEGRVPPDAWNAPGRRRLFGLLTAAVLALFLEFAPRATFLPPSALAAEADNAAANVIPPTEPAGSLSEELRRLNQELDQFDREMQRAERLLEDLPDHPEIRDLVDRIHRKASQLRRRRDTFHRLRPASR